MVESTLFWIFAAVAVVSALGVVLNRSIIYSALCLLSLFMTIAGFFFLNNTDFLGIAQILVYAVGLTIILLFAIMFTGDRQVMDKPVPRPLLLAYGIIGAYTFAVLIRATLFPFSQEFVMPGSPLAQAMEVQGSTNLLGQLMFTRYVLPFELASMLLLGAMIGAIILALRTLITTDLGDTKLTLDTAATLTDEARAARLVNPGLERAAGPQPGAGPETSAPEQEAAGV